jgi:uncharacterized membrane protein
LIFTNPWKMAKMARKSSKTQASDSWQVTNLDPILAFVLAVVVCCLVAIVIAIGIASTVVGLCIIVIVCALMSLATLAIQVAVILSPILLVGCAMAWAFEII